MAETAQLIICERGTGDAGGQLLRLQLSALFVLDARAGRRGATPRWSGRRRRTRALGVYLHIPFCRKRCHFCYFRVYTDKNSLGDPALPGRGDRGARALRAASRSSAAGSRTSSTSAAARPPISRRGSSPPDGRDEGLLPWDEAEEVTFECEPGTLTEPKLGSSGTSGVTRLSLGVEHFDERILRAQRPRARREGDRPRLRVRPLDRVPADQHRSDRRHDGRHRREVAGERSRRRIELQPDSVTIYQMEIPYNTTIFQEMKAQGQEVAPVAELGRRSAQWVRSAFDAARGGRLHDHQRLHRRQGSGAHEVRLPRPALDRRGPDRPGRGLLLARGRHPLPERAQLGPLHRPAQRGRTADLPRA